MMRTLKQTLTLAFSVLVPLLVLGLGSAHADSERNGAVKLLTTIPVPGNLTPLRAFDISWVDQDTQLYYLADRSNASVDVVNTKTNTFVKHITGGFAGVVPNATGSGANNNVSGPNGVVVSGRWLFVTDAGSRVVTIDLTTDTIVSHVVTKAGDPLRADELAYDPDDGLLLVVNNADDPPFATLISVNKATGALTVVKNITFSTAATGVDATNGAEQPVWDPGTRKFYLSIPEIGGPGDGTGPNGAVIRIDPHSGAVEKIFPVQHCQPAGLTLGPRQDLLIGCSQAFDTAGNAWTSTDPLSAKPISVIMDAKTGAIDKNVEGVSGNDEVWFNRGDGRYYLAARANPVGPTLGVIDAEDQRLVQLVPTINTAASVKKIPGCPGTPSCLIFPSGTSHSVAVDAHNNHAIVPLPANNVFPNCLNGCFGVFGVPGEGKED
jgi:hypothetical protein